MSTAVLLSVPRLLLAFVPMLAVFTMALSGCDVTDSDALETVGEGEGEGEGEAPGPDLGSACDVPVVAGNEVCSTCEGVEICGVADVAVCETRENSAGRACQLCIGASGTILYNDCSSADDVDAARCELTPGSTPDEVCRSCFDDLGSIVSIGCAPAADRCEADVDVDGRTCNRCYNDDVLVSTACTPPDLDPRFCRAYDNDAGRCIDCYGDDDVLLTHDCRLIDNGAESPQQLSCESRFAGGLTCTTCADTAGQVVSQVCRDDVPGSDRCERLEFSEQSCVVCVDTTDTVVFVDCVASACATAIACRADSDCGVTEQVCFDGRCVGRAGSDGGGENEPALGACVDTPTCSTSRNASNELCRTCPTDAGTSETRCLSASSLTCETLAENALPPSDTSTVGEAPEGSPEDPSARPPPQGRTCVLCRDRAAGVEVYRDCEGNGTVPPPYCIDTSDVDGGSCAACYDAISGALVYSACDDDVCYAHADITLRDDDGVPLAIDGSTAIVGCKSCADGAGDDVSCALRDRCDDGLSADASACEGAATSTTVTIYPRVCRNPWASWRTSEARDADLAGIMGYALDVHVLVVSAATSTTITPPACAVDDCSCSRGDAVALDVAEVDRPRVERAFSSLLVP